MLLRMLQVANLLLAGVNTGICISHALQAPQKAKLERRSYLAAQQTLYLKYGRAATILEPAALASSLTLALMLRERRSEPLLMTLSAACSISEIAVWKFWIDPINRQVAGWTQDRMPRDWARLRDRWHLLHGARAAVYLTAFSASAVTAVQGSQSRSTTHRVATARAA